MLTKQGRYLSYSDIYFFHIYQQVLYFLYRSSVSKMSIIGYYPNGPSIGSFLDFCIATSFAMRENKLLTRFEAKGKMLFPIKKV